jgi:hypothetical protein
LIIEKKNNNKRKMMYACVENVEPKKVARNIGHHISREQYIEKK